MNELNAAAAARLLRRLGFSSTSNYHEVDRYERHYDTWVSGRSAVGMFVNVSSDPSVERGNPAIADSMRRAEAVAEKLLEAGYPVCSQVDFRDGLDGHAYYCRYSGSVTVLL